MHNEKEVAAIVGRIDTLRERRGMSKAEISRIVTDGQNPHYFTGLTSRSQNMSIDRMIALAGALGVSPCAFLLPGDPDQLTEMAEILQDADDDALRRIHAIIQAALGESAA